jgi:4-aminobutyrate aminotransferase / (S)-3-amino-2-methylpropionate transaminase / 5-aminovalerate transaminase
LPLAGVSGRSELMDAVHGGGLGGTYGGNPVSCASALGAIEVMGRLDLAGRARHIGDLVLGRLRELAAAHPEVGDVRGRGAMCAMELVHSGTLDPDPEAAVAVAGRCHAEGVVVLTCGTFGNVVRLLPPLVIDDDQLEDGLDVLGAAVGTLSGAGPPARP